MLPADFTLRAASALISGLVHGVWYYATVKATNGAGNFGTVTTDGWQADLIAPYCGYVLDGPGFDLDFRYPLSLDGGATTTVDVSWVGMWDGFRGSGIVAYEVTVASGIGTPLTKT